jgi:hypothetical protein
VAIYIATFNLALAEAPQKTMDDLLSILFWNNKNKRT